MQGKPGISLFTLVPPTLTWHLVSNTERSPRHPRPPCDPLEPGKSVGHRRKTRCEAPPSHSSKIPSVGSSTSLPVFAKLGEIKKTFVPGMGSVRVGLAGRFLWKKWAKKFGPKKALLSRRRAASLLYTLYKPWCKSCGAEWYSVGRSRLNKPIPTRPHCCPCWPEPRTLTRESSKGVNTGIIP